MARPPPPTLCVTPTSSYPTFLPPCRSPRRLAYNHPVAVGSRFERETSRASIFRVKDGATDAIGPRRGLPRRVVVCGASHRSHLRPMRSPQNQPLASCRLRPATYLPTPTAPTSLPTTCSLAVLRARSLVIPLCRLSPDIASAPACSLIPSPSDTL